MLNLSTSKAEMADRIVMPFTVVSIAEGLNEDNASTFFVVALAHQLRNSEPVNIMIHDASRAEVYARFPMGATINVQLDFPIISIKEDVPANESTAAAGADTSAHDVVGEAEAGGFITKHPSLVPLAEVPGNDANGSPVVDAAPDADYPEDAS